MGSVPGLRRSPEEGNDSPLQYAFLGNPMDRGAWWVTVPGVAKSRLTRMHANQRQACSYYLKSDSLVYRDVIKFAICSDVMGPQWNSRENIQENALLFFPCFLGICLQAQGLGIQTRGTPIHCCSSPGFLACWWVDTSPSLRTHWGLKVVLTLTFRKQLSCPASGTFWVPHRCIGISRNLLLSIIRAIKYFLSALILKTDTEVHWEIYNVVFFPAFTSSPKLGSKYKISFHTWPDIKWHKQLKRLWGIMWVPWRWLSEFTANCVKFSIALQEEHFQNNEHLHWGLAGRVYYCWWWLFCSVLCF